MKLNKLMAAALVALAGVANATLNQPVEGNGSLLFLALDAEGSPVSMAVDLGLGVDQFRTFDPVNFTYVSEGGLTSGYHKITWDFANNTVTTTTPTSVVTYWDTALFATGVVESAVVTTTTGDLVASINAATDGQNIQGGNAWSAANAAFQGLAQANQVRFAVIAPDSGNAYYLSSGTNEAAMQVLDNNSANNFGLTDLGLYQTTKQQGTHATTANGANTAAGTVSPSLIDPAIWGNQDGWVTNSNFGANSQPGVTQTNFFSLDLNNSIRRAIVGEEGGPVSNAAALLGNRATWTYDFTNSLLTYETVQAIPEPSTYALMGLGLVGVVLAARRRKA